MPANSVPNFKGIKIYFKKELIENELYTDSIKMIIKESCRGPSFQLLTILQQFSVKRIYIYIYMAKTETCKHHD